MYIVSVAYAAINWKQYFALSAHYTKVGLNFLLLLIVIVLGRTVYYLYGNNIVFKSKIHCVLGFGLPGFLYYLCCIFSSQSKKLEV